MDFFSQNLYSSQFWWYFRLLSYSIFISLVFSRNSKRQDPVFSVSFRSKDSFNIKKKCKFHHFNHLLTYFISSGMLFSPSAVFNVCCDFSMYLMIAFQRKYNILHVNFIFLFILNAIFAISFIYNFQSHFTSVTISFWVCPMWA